MVNVKPVYLGVIAALSITSLIICCIQHRTIIHLTNNLQRNTESLLSCQDKLTLAKVLVDKQNPELLQVCQEQLETSKNQVKETIAVLLTTTTVVIVCAVILVAPVIALK